MQLVSLSSLLLSGLLLQVNAAPSFNASEEVSAVNETKPEPRPRGPGYVHVPIKKIQMPDETFKNEYTKVDDDMSKDPYILKAVADFDEKLNNQRYYYLADVKIGTPPQHLSLLVDTGSSDTWVFTPQTEGNSRSSGAASVFNSQDSKTFRFNSTNYQIQYGKGNSQGAWGHDVFQIGGATVENLSIGLASKVSQINTGLVGIGRPQAESTFTSGGQMYLNLPLKMRAEGIINSAAYSMALNDVNSGSGSLLFGAVDHDRFTGTLTSLPITHPSHLGVTVQGMYAEGVANYNLMKAPTTAILDSGTSLSYVDGATLDAYRTAVNSNPSFLIGGKYYTDCNVSDSMTIDFGATRIKIPAYNYLWPIDMFVNKISAAVAFPRNSCYIGIDKSSEDFFLFGDNFLRGMYIVYDITDNRIGLAPLKPSSGEPDIAVIEPGKPFPFSSV